jgi:acetyl esterase/lipase
MTAYTYPDPPTFDSPDDVRDGVEVFRTVPYRTTPSGTYHITLHRPTGPGPHPLLVYVHGGGWRAGDRHWGGATSHARMGLTVASVEYRLSGTATYPAAVRDVVAAVTWLRTRAASTAGIDPDRVVLVGGSAGAHLVALVGTAPDVDAFQPLGLDSTHADDIDGVIPISGVYDLRPDWAATDPAAVAFFGCTGHECPARYAEASPVVHVDGDDPPTLVFHGTDDERIPYRTATAYRDALDAAGVPVTLLTAEGGGHGNIFSGPWADRMRRAKQDFLERRLDIDLPR